MSKITAPYVNKRLVSTARTTSVSEDVVRKAAKQSGLKPAFFDDLGWKLFGPRVKFGTQHGVIAVTSTSFGAGWTVNIEDKNEDFVFAFEDCGGRKLIKQADKVYASVEDPESTLKPVMEFFRKVNAL